jgi:CubicO group peptidase (beta-lactamase class C family)
MEYDRAMISRRQFIAGAGGSVVLVATGCAGSNSTTAPATDAPTSTLPASTGPTATVPTSTGPTATVPTSLPWSGADFAGLDRYLEQTNTNAFRVVEDAAVVHEWYRDDETFARDIASAQKSVLSLLVGRAVGDGAITVDTPIDDVLGSAWTTHGQTADITVGHLLTMTSGLDDRFQVIAEPGAEWHYSGAFAALFDVLTTVTGRGLNDLADEWLFTPAGAATAEFHDRRAAMFAPIGLLARASDLTAIGQTVLDATQPGLAADWLDDSFAPGSPMNGSYGYLWWLNGQASFRLPGTRQARPGPLIPSAPTDLVAALGKDDQKLYVSGEHRLVVSRLGASSGERRAAPSAFDVELWERLVDLRAA